MAFVQLLFYEGKVTAGTDRFSIEDDYENSSARYRLLAQFDKHPGSEHHWEDIISMRLLFSTSNHNVLALGLDAVGL